MRIHLWTADTGGSGWYRGHLVGTGLTWLNHRVTVDSRLPEDHGDLDAIVGCRVALPAPTKAWRQFKDRGIRCVLDLDDDYFHLDPTNGPAITTWDADMRRRLADNLALADVVTCCSQPLATVLREHADDVRVIPNGLPAQSLATPRDYAADGRPVYVGWAGTSSTVAELPLAVRALNRIADYQGRPGRVAVRLVGVDPQVARVHGVRGGRDVGALGWVPNPQEYLARVAQFDVWVAPYRDVPFNRAKFPTKAMEAGFLGIPLVASAVGEYRSAVVHGETGFLVPPGQEHLFGRYVRQLVDDPGLRQRMGLAARARASGSILQALNQQWEAVLTAPAKEAAA